MRESVKRLWSTPKLVQIGDHSTVEGSKLLLDAEAYVAQHCGLVSAGMASGMCLITGMQAVSTARIHAGAGSNNSATRHFMGIGTTTALNPSTDFLPYGPS